MKFLLSIQVIYSCIREHKKIVAQKSQQIHSTHLGPCSPLSVNPVKNPHRSGVKKGGYGEIKRGNLRELAGGI